MKFPKFLLSLLACILFVTPVQATVPSETAVIQYTLNINPMVCPIPFVFTNASDLIVLDSRGVGPVTLTINSDYAVTGGAGSTGSITTIPGGAHGVRVGDLITILRGVPMTQTTAFTNTGPLTASMIGQAFDKQTEISQQINQNLSQALKFEQQETLSSLLSLSLRKGKYLAFDSTGLPVFLGSTDSPSGDASLALVTATGSNTARDLAVRFSERVNVKDFGAIGGGLSDDTSSVQAALTYAAAQGKALYAPAGTYLCGMITVPANSFIEGDGMGKTVFKATASALLAAVFNIPTGNDDVTIRNLTVDGNRSSSGTSETTSGCILAAGKRFTAAFCELRYGNFAGIYFGSATVACDLVTIQNCWIHDNGGALTNTGNAAGIFGWGFTTNTRVAILDCVIENNYNTVTKPNDSCGINVFAKGIVIRGCRLKNNYNGSGGQIVIDGGGSGTVDSIVDECLIEKTGSFGTPADQTSGIEINGRGFSVTNCVVVGNHVTGIYVEGAGGGAGTITGNRVSGTDTGISMLVGSVIDSVNIIGNSVASTAGSGYGITVDSVQTNLLVAGNTLVESLIAFGGTRSSTAIFIGNLYKISSTTVPSNQQLTNTGTSVSLTTNTEANITSLTLEAGVWDVWGSVVFGPAATTLVKEQYVKVSSTSQDSSYNIGQYERISYGDTGIVFNNRKSASVCPIKRFTITSPTTIYLIARQEFTISTATADGKIFAQRVADF